MQEEWRDIKGYEGLYQVSNFGRVRSLPQIRRDGRILGRNIKSGNIVQYALSKDHVLKSYTAHRLVVDAFPEICGEWFEGCNIHHKDHNRLNNSAENLKVMTIDEHKKLHQESEITSEKNRAAARSRWQKRKGNIAA